MLRTFVILLEIAALVFLLRTAVVQFWLEDTHESLSDWFLELSKSGERLELNDLRESMRPLTESMKDYQQDYLLDVTQSKESVELFYQRYCQGKDKNPFIYGDKLNRFCGNIKSSKLLEKI